MHTLLGQGYRLDHQPIVIAQDKDRRVKRFIPCFPNTLHMHMHDVSHAI
jgi:hypothetical protein